MEYIIEKENIVLDYNKERSDYGESEYRLTTYDKYGHFEGEIYLSEKQLLDLKNGLLKTKIDEN